MALSRLEDVTGSELVRDILTRLLVVRNGLTPTELGEVRCSAHLGRG